jgi:hypothetical protein
MKHTQLMSGGLGIPVAIIVTGLLWWQRGHRTEPVSGYSAIEIIANGNVRFVQRTCQGVR